MKPIVYVNSDVKNSYEDSTLIGRIKDRFRISFLGESFIKELGLNISRVKLPPNFNEKAYWKNLEIVRRKVRNKDIGLDLKT